MCDWLSTGLSEEAKVGTVVRCESEEKEKMSMKEIEWLLQNRSAVAKEPWISVNDCQVLIEQTTKERRQHKRSGAAH
jgi:hypothetical protein